jgi:hypothetical protein
MTFFILQVRVCGDLTAVEQRNACYLPEPRDRRGLLLGPIPGAAGRLVPAVIHDFFYSTGDSVQGLDSSGAAQFLLLA